MEFGPVALWESMGLFAKAVSLILIGLSIYSITVSIERWLVYRAAKKQSLEFAKQVTQFLKQNRPQDAIAAARKYKHSHLAKVVAAGLVSNTLGTINPLDRLTAWAHEQGAIMVVDAAQAVPHRRVDVQALDCDFLGFTSHKICGPTGAGALYGRRELLERPAHGTESALEARR